MAGPLPCFCLQWVVLCRAGGNWGCLLHPWLLMLCTTGRTWYRRLCLVLHAVPRAGVPVGPGAACCVLWCRCFVLPGCTRYCRLFAARAVMPCIALYALWATPALMPLYGRALSLQLFPARAGAVQAL